MGKKNEEKDTFAIVYRIWGDNGNPIYTVDPEALRVEAEGKDSEDVPLMEYSMLQKYMLKDGRVAFSLDEMNNSSWNEIKDVDAL